MSIVVGKTKSKTNPKEPIKKEAKNSTTDIFLSLPFKNDPKNKKYEIEPKIPMFTNIETAKEWQSVSPNPNPKSGDFAKMSNE